MEIDSSLDNDIIIGCSSGNVSNSALAVIRISGFFSLAKFSSFFSISLESIVPRQMYLTRIVNGPLLLDELLFSFFAAPSSYTGESILELYPHGNVLNVERIIDAFIDRFSLRLARPGEFTLRAYKNKKLNFAQIEGLELLLNANSQFAFQQGLEILNGELFHSYRQLYDNFIALSSSCDLLIDFSEDVGEEEGRKNLDLALHNFEKIITVLHQRCNIQSTASLNPKIVLFGPTNAGKSTFFNYLLSENRSIVSPVAGTTRDFISEHIKIDGNAFVLIDSAGLREIADNSIEEEGIRRSKSLHSSSFFKALVVSSQEFNSSLVDEYDFDVLLVTHSDLIDPLKFSLPATKKPVLFVGPMGPDNSAAGSIGPVGNYFVFHSHNQDFGPIGPEASPALPIFNRLVSLKLQALIASNPILIERQKHVISSIYTRFAEVLSAQRQSDLGVISSKISDLGVVINELIGVVTPEDSLNLIFSKFCIGK